MICFYLEKDNKKSTILSIEEKQELSTIEKEIEVYVEVKMRISEKKYIIN